jgi:hypothetical protein
MFFNISIFVLYFYLILLSIIGYGIWFCKFFKISIEATSFGIIGLLGIFFLTLISYLTNIFFSHNLTHNLVILLLGFLFFLYQLFFKKNIPKIEIIKILLICLLFLSGLFMSKNNEDFGYYHFAYILNITENKTQFGLANFNSGFGTQSSIFYFTSLLYLPIIKYYLFNAHSLLVLIFANIFLLDYFFFKKINNINFINILSLFSFVFINLIFSRLAEYGTDRAGQIIVFIIIIITLNISKKKIFFEDSIKTVLILISYVVSIKSYFIIYVLLLPLLYLKLNNEFKIFILRNVRLIFSLFLFLFLFFFINIANTGCIIYPLSFTCFPNIFWSVPLDTVKNLNQWFELWSKSGATPNYVVQDRINYIQNFNWLSTWISNYFFTKGTDFLGSIIAIITTIVFLFKSKIIIKRKILPRLKYMIFFLIFSFFVWFNKHPDLRYGGFVIISLIFFIFPCVYLSKYKIIYKFINLKILFIVFIVTLSFNLRNYFRILSEFNRNDVYKFNNFPFFSDEYLKTNINFHLLYKKIRIGEYNFYYHQ